MGTSTNPFRTKVELDAVAMSIRVQIIKKEDDSVLESAEFPATSIAETLRGNVALYGYSKLLQDRTSEVEVGPGKIAAMQALAEQFAKGVWSAERKAGSPVVSAEVEALAQLKECTVPEMQSALKKYTAEVKEAIFKNPKVVELAATIRAGRKSAETINLDDLAVAAA